MSAEIELNSKSGPPSPMLNYRDTLLRMYDVVNRKIDNLDTVGARIKTWGVTLWSVLTAQYIARGGDSHMLLGVALLLLASLWVVDLHYKFFQEQFIALNVRIEIKLLDEDVTVTDIASLSIRNNITGRIFTQSGVHPEFMKTFGRYWFHLAYVVMVLSSCIMRVCL
jgi:hypothetical protein